MFGFLGKPYCKLIIEANGAVSGSNRDFITKMGAKVNNFPGRYFADFDNVGSDPNQQFILSASIVSFDSLPKAQLPLTVLTAVGGISIGGVNYSLNHGKASLSTPSRGFRYTSNAVLSPATRKTLFELPFYFTTLIGLGVDTNNTGRTSASNSSMGSVTFNLAQFPELETFSINESFISTLVLKFNNPKLVNVSFQELTNISTLTAVLPSTVISLIFSEVTQTSVSTLMQNCINVKSLMFGGYSGLIDTLANPTSTLTGTLDVSHMTDLREFLLPPNSGLTSIVLPSGKSNWEWVHINGMGATAAAAFSTTRIDEWLASSTIRAVVFQGNNKTWSRNFTESDIQTNMMALYLYGNSITGDFIIDVSRPNIIEIKLGIATTENNRMANIDVTGFNSGALKMLQIAGLECTNLLLPTTMANLTSLYAFDNKLDITTNTDLVTKINGYTALTDLRLGNASALTGASSIGQVSTNGLGANPDFSGLVNMTFFSINSCKITGTLTLPNVNKLVSFVVSENTGLTAFANFLSHTGLTQLFTRNCSSLVFSITNVFTSIVQVVVDGSGITSIDLSGKTSLSLFTTFNVDNCTSLTSITFPTTTGRASFTNNISITGPNCSALTSMSNMDQINWFGVTGTAINTFDFRSCALNITFPLGANSFIPRTIRLDNNGMNTTNVDATIDSMYTNKSKWSTYTSLKSMNIAGTNAAATGTFQAPTGFVLGSNDGTPASQQEKLYVLVNNYGWNITAN